MKNPNKSHPGKAGRKASPFPLFNKEFRATPEEQAEFLKLLPGDAREDFEQVMKALEVYETFLGAKDVIDQLQAEKERCVSLIWPMYDLIQQIEICGASVELTKAVTMASDIMHKLMDATGQKQLPAKTNDV